MVWKIKKGDLVKVREYHDGREDSVTYNNGVVISDIITEDTTQQPLWPYVNVYMVNTQNVSSCGPAKIEIISNS